MRSLSKRPANKLAARLRQRLDNARRLDSVMRADLAMLLDAHTRLQARFDLLRESTSDGLWDVELGERKLMDPANEFIWSEQVRRMVGYGDASELPNGLDSLLRLLHPDDVTPTVTAFTAHIHDRSGQTPYDVTYRLRCKNGEYRWFRAISHAQRNEAGRAIRVAGALTDITDRRTMQALKRYAEAIVASLPTGLMVLDGELYIQSMNRAFCDIVGLADEAQMRGQDFGTVIPKSSIRELAASLLAEGETRQGIGVDLGDKHLRVAMAAIVLAEGERRLLVMAEDVTEEQRLRDEARHNAARHREQASLLDKARDAIIVRGIDGRVLFWNKGAQRLYGWSSDEVLGQRIDHWLYRDGPAASAAVVKITLEAGEWSGEIAQRRKDGALLTVEGYWTLVRDEEERPKAFLVINTDITQRKASDEKIRNLALYDTLTGLANRTLLTDRMASALERANQADDPLAVLFLDLNRFKEINDTQGHGVGDQVLVKVARRFQAALREEEVLARLAGDEFVVVAERADAAVAARIAGRLVDAMQDPVATHGQTFPVGLSIGIATFPRDGACMDDLLKRADIAMYRAKAAGGGFMFYQPEMSVGLLERIELAKDLSRALSEGGLELHFQPQVDLASGRAIGAEALLRWRDPQRGWVSPGVFIPIAESRGMICALGRWVLGAGRSLPPDARLGRRRPALPGAAMDQPRCPAAGRSGSRVQHPRHHRRRRHRTRLPGAGADRKRPDGRRGRLDPHHGHLARRRVRDRDRRLRHGVFVAGLFEASAGRQAEDRHVLCARHADRPPRLHHRHHHHRHGAQPGAGGDCRGRGRRRASAGLTFAGLRRGAGVLLRAAGAGRCVCREVVERRVIAAARINGGLRPKPYGGHPVPTRLRAHPFARGGSASPANPKPGHVHRTLDERRLTAADYGPVRTAWARSAHRTVSAAGRCWRWPLITHANKKCRPVETGRHFH